jgi:hypothetical protein
MTPRETAIDLAAWALHRAAGHADCQGGLCMRCPIEAETALEAVNHWGVVEERDRLRALGERGEA